MKLTHELIEPLLLFLLLLLIIHLHPMGPEKWITMEKFYYYLSHFISFDHLSEIKSSEIKLKLNTCLTFHFRARPSLNCGS